MGYVGTVVVAQIIQVFKMVLHPANVIQIVPILVVPNLDGVDQNLIIMNRQSYEIKSPPWTILWFRILVIFSVENKARLGVFMFQTSDNSQLWIDSQYSSQ